MDEEWRPVVGFPDYAVSSLGRVRRVVPDRRGLGADRVLRQHPNTRGYLTVSLSRDGKDRTVPVHRLVCEAFHGPAPAGHQVAHWNGVNSDNLPENLRWATPSSNSCDKRRHGTMLVGDAHPARLKPECFPRGSKVGTSKLTEETVLLIRADTRKLADIAAAYGLNISHVCEIRTRKWWRHVP